VSICMLMVLSKILLLSLRAGSFVKQAVYIHWLKIQKATKRGFRIDSERDATRSFVYLPLHEHQLWHHFLAKFE